MKIPAKENILISPQPLEITRWIKACFFVSKKGTAFAGLWLGF